MLAQSKTCSDYKHHNTWKWLVGVTLNGQVSFLSDLWGGQMSQTNHMGKLSTGFTGTCWQCHGRPWIRYIKNSSLWHSRQHATTLGWADQMTAAETEETMSIASVQIHVEGAIGRIKTSHILDGTLPNTLTPYATQIAVVCGLLTNFLLPLLEPSEEPLNVSE